jgi:hypothetical protein
MSKNRNLDNLVESILRMDYAQKQHFVKYLRKKAKRPITKRRISRKKKQPSSELQGIDIPTHLLTAVPFELKDVPSSWNVPRAARNLVPISNTGNTCFFAAALQTLLSMTDLVHYFSSYNGPQLAQLVQANAALPYLLPSTQQHCSTEDEQSGLEFMEGFALIVQEVGRASVLRLDTLMLNNGESVQQRFTRLIEQRVGEVGEVHHFLDKFFNPMVCLCPKADPLFKCMLAAVSSLSCDHDQMRPYWRFTHMHLLYVQTKDGGYVRGDVQSLVDTYQLENEVIFSTLNRYLLLQLSVPEHNIKLSPTLLVKNELNRTMRQYSLKGAIIYVSQVHFIFVQFDTKGRPSRVYNDDKVYAATNVDEKNAVVLLYEFRTLA